jgi:tRNA/rRNA methyltransferase
MKTRLSHLRIVLVEPAGPLNIGAVARIMRNMGLSRLVLVNPQCDPRAEAARRMAVHGVEVLAAARVVASLPEALEGCQRAIATTGRLHPQDHPLEVPEIALPWLIPPTPAATTPDHATSFPIFESALIFGPEDRGLSNDELMYAQRWVRIPASDSYPSLNLAQAVAVCAYLLHSMTQTSTPTETRFQPQSAIAYAVDPDQAPLDQMEGFFQDLESLLLKIGYLYPILLPVGW